MRNFGTVWLRYPAGHSIDNFSVVVARWYCTALCGKWLSVLRDRVSAAGVVGTRGIGHVGE